MRTTVSTMAAVLVGLFNIVAGRGERRPIELVVGDVAPDFELIGSDGHTHRLSDSRGREAVVLAWFPKAFTTGCTAECRSLGRSRDALRAFKVRYFGANIDGLSTNRAFALSMGIDYPILSDPGGAVARRFGVIGASGFPRRWTFYIDPDGRILDVERHVCAATHGEDVAARLESLNISRQA